MQQADARVDGLGRTRTPRWIAGNGTALPHVSEAPQVGRSHEGDLHDQRHGTRGPQPPQGHRARQALKGGPLRSITGPEAAPSKAVTGPPYKGPTSGPLKGAGASPLGEQLLWGLWRRWRRLRSLTHLEIFRAKNGRNSDPSQSPQAAAALENLGKIFWLKNQTSFIDNI